MSVYALVMESLDWLEANPARHITGKYANDKNQHATAPTSPSACQFCFVGRVMKDANLHRTHDAETFLRFIGVDMTEAMRLNDQGAPPATLRAYVQQCYTAHQARHA